MGNMKEQLNARAQGTLRETCKGHLKELPRNKSETIQRERTPKGTFKGTFTGNVEGKLDGMLKEHMQDTLTKH